MSLLQKHLEWVRKGRGDQKGRALLLRGRRRVGKSRLVEVFCETAGLPYLVFQASRHEPPDVQRQAFGEAVLRSSLPNRDLFAGVQVDSWSAAWRQLASVLPDDQPSIVVIDEFPWLLEQDRAAEGQLQTLWDRELSRKPVLLVLIGSDLTTMERLTDYQRPFYQRAVEMVLPPLSPQEVARMTQLGPAEAFDAYLITGGLPLIAQEWEPGWAVKDFLQHTLDDPTSPLLVSGERLLAAEFPNAPSVRRVLTALGGGSRSFSSLAAGISNAALSPTLQTLTSKGVVAIDEPLSTKSGERNRRYRVDEPYLRFWLEFLERAIPEVERGRGQLAAETIARSWPGWRGAAIEPVVRDALRRLLPNDNWPDAKEIGGWWNRVNNPEVDLVGADRVPARQVAFVGSIKWGDRRVFTDRDLRELATMAAAVPGVTSDTPLVAVSRGGFATEGLTSRYGPEELLQAWDLAT